MTTHFKVLILCLATILFTTSCSKEGSNESPLAAVSIEPLKNIFETIAGDRFRTYTIMPQGNNPETFELSSIGRFNVEKSDLIITTGLMPFEKQLLKSSDNKQRFINVSEGIDFIYGTHYHNDANNRSKRHAHKVADPHVWLSPQNNIIIARNIKDYLCRIDPKNAETYESNYKIYAQKLEAIDADISAKLSDLKVKSFIVWHPSLSYFAKDYGLNQISVSSDNKEASVGSVASIIKQAKEKGVKVMFFQKEFDMRQASTISDELNANVILINPVSYDWESQLQIIVDGLTE